MTQYSALLMTGRNDSAILNVWDTDCHLVHENRRNNYVLLPCIPIVPLYMQSTQVGSTMVAEIMYAKW